MTCYDARKVSWFSIIKKKKNTWEILKSYWETMVACSSPCEDHCPIIHPTFSGLLITRQLRLYTFGPSQYSIATSVAEDRRVMMLVAIVTGWQLEIKPQWHKCETNAVGKSWHKMISILCKLAFLALWLTFLLMLSVSTCGTSLSFSPKAFSISDTRQTQQRHVTNWDK